MARIYVDMRFFEIEREIWAIGEYLKTIPAQVQQIVAQDRHRTSKILGAAGANLDEAEIQAELDEMHERTEKVFPRFVHIPCIVSIWACYESGVTEVADFLADGGSKKLRIRDVRRGNFVKNAESYYSTVLNVSLDNSEDRLARLADLLVIRNAIAHRNGRSGPSGTADGVKSVLARTAEISVTEGYIDPSPVYLQNAYSDVSTSLGDLVWRVRGGPAVRFPGAA